MSDTLLSTVKGTGGAQDMQVRYASSINGCPAIALFLSAYSALIEANNTQPLLLTTNKSEVIYAIVNKTVVGVLMFVVYADTYKTVLVQFVHVTPDHRGARIFQHMFTALEQRVKAFGCKKITGNIHIKNKDMLTAMTRIGAFATFYKVEKNL
jgi:GNAT superfamily N-acetyltransferase